MHAPTGKRPMRVLVVEDEAMIALVIEDALDALGCEMVGPIARLDEALAAARTERFDCAVLDVNICGDYVFPVADLLIEKGIPFVLATGYAASTLPEHLRGVRRLTKPYVATQLESELDRMKIGLASTM